MSILPPSRNQNEDEDVDEGFCKILSSIKIYPRSSDVGHWLRHGHQHCGGDLEGESQETVPGPGSLLCLHGGFFFYYGWCYSIHDARRAKDFKKFGWGVAAAVTPVTLLATGCVFFSLVLKPGSAPLCGALCATPLMLAVLVGAAQNIASKSTKYALFDPCKEMAYIPLDAEQKTKGKAAVDVIGNPLGKSGGALVQQMLILSLGSLAACGRRTSRRSSSASSSSGCARRGASQGAIRGRRWRPRDRPPVLRLYVLARVPGPAATCWPRGPASMASSDQDSHRGCVRAPGIFPCTPFCLPRTPALSSAIVCRLQKMHGRATELA